MMPYKFLCDTKILCGIQNLLYMVIGSSVSRKACDKISWMAIYGRWIVSVTKIMQRRSLIFVNELQEG